MTVAADERRRPWRREVATAQLPEQASSYDPTSGADETDLLRRTLAELPARQRAAVVMRYHEGLSAAQTRTCPLQGRPYVEISELEEVGADGGSVFAWALRGGRDCEGLGYEVEFRPTAPRPSMKQGWL